MRLLLAALALLFAFPAAAADFESIAAKGGCDANDDGAKKLRDEQGATRIVTPGCDTVVWNTSTGAVFTTTGRPEATIRLVSRAGGKMRAIETIQFGNDAPIPVQAGSCSPALIIDRRGPETRQLMILCSIAYRRDNETIGVAMIFIGTAKI